MKTRINKESDRVLESLASLFVQYVPAIQLKEFASGLDRLAMGGSVAGDVLARASHHLRQELEEVK